MDSTKESRLRKSIEDFINILKDEQYPNVKGMLKNPSEKNRLIDIIEQKLLSNKRETIKDIVSEIEISTYEK